MIRAASIAVLAGTCLVSLAAAQEPAGKESGASVWRQVIRTFVHPDIALLTLSIQHPDGEIEAISTVSATT